MATVRKEPPGLVLTSGEDSDSDYDASAVECEKMVFYYFIIFNPQKSIILSVTLNCPHIFANSPSVCVFLAPLLIKQIFLETSGPASKVEV